MNFDTTQPEPEQPITQYRVRLQVTVEVTMLVELEGANRSPEYATSAAINDLKLHGISNWHHYTEDIEAWDYKVSETIKLTTDGKQIQE